jgi:hypothetical protein
VWQDEVKFFLKPYVQAKKQLWAEAGGALIWRKKAVVHIECATALIILTKFCEKN